MQNIFFYSIIVGISVYFDIKKNDWGDYYDLSEHIQFSADHS